MTDVLNKLNLLFVNLWNRRLTRWMLVSVGVISLFGIFSLLAIAIPLDGDEGMYAAAGKFVSQGLRPFSDFFITKPPVIYAVTSLIYRIIPDTGSPLLSFYLIRLIPIVLHILSIVLFYKLLVLFLELAKKQNERFLRIVNTNSSLQITSKKQALIGTLIFVLSFNSLYIGSTLKAETIIAFLILGAVYFLLSGWFKKKTYLYIPAGVFIGIVLLTKYTSVTVLVLFVFIALLLKGTIKEKLVPTLVVAISATLTFILFLVLFKVTFDIDLQTLFDYTFNTFIKYDKLAPESTLFKAQTILTFLAKEFVFLVAFVMTTTVVVLSGFKKKFRMMVADFLNSFLLKLVGGWVVIDFALNMILPKIRYNYLLDVLVPLSILSLLLIKYAITWLKENSFTLKEVLLSGFSGVATMVLVFLFNDFQHNLDRYPIDGSIYYTIEIFTLQNLLLLIVFFGIAVLVALAYKGKIRGIFAIYALRYYLLILVPIVYAVILVIPNIYIYAPQYFNYTQDIVNISSKIRELPVDKIATFQGLSGAFMVMTNKQLANNRITDITLRFDYNLIDLNELPVNFISPNKVFQGIKETEYIVMDPISWRFLYKFQREMYNYLYWNYSTIEQSGYLQLIRKDPLPTYKSQPISMFNDEPASRMISESSSYNPFNGRMYFSDQQQLGIKLQFSSYPIGETRFSFDQEHSKIESTPAGLQVTQQDDRTDSYLVNVTPSNGYQFDLNSINPFGNNQLAIFSRNKTGYVGEGQNLQIKYGDKVILDLSKISTDREDFAIDELLGSEVGKQPLQEFVLASEGRNDGIKISGKILKIRVRKSLDRSTFLFDIPAGNAITITYFSTINN